MTMLFDSLKHGVVLFLITRDLAVEVRSKLHGAFCGVVDGREAVDQLPESLEIVIVFPFNRRFRKKSRIEIAELSITRKSNYCIVLFISI